MKTHQGIAIRRARDEGERWREVRGMRAAFVSLACRRSK
ncbi:hypothetical protein BURPS668_A2486 [Burkholderia pseudomallei 668]|nr:hypothetical protein BURPS668_A2486 [Burkholderia pseudomallei 668]